MPRVLEYLEDTVIDNKRVYRCLKCQTVLGSANNDYKTMVGHFDTQVSVGEPKQFATDSDRYILRHYCCPSCGVMLEIDMLEKGDSSTRSIHLT